MQLQQPLAFLHIALAPRQILSVSCVHEIDFETAFFQNLVQWNPIHTSGLGRIRAQSATWALEADARPHPICPPPRKGRSSTAKRREWPGNPGSGSQESVGTSG